MPPILAIQRVNVDFELLMLEELDISRQAVIKTLLQQALDQGYLAHGIR